MSFKQNRQGWMPGSGWLQSRTSGRFWFNTDCEIWSLRVVVRLANLYALCGNITKLICYIQYLAILHVSKTQNTWEWNWVNLPAGVGLTGTHTHLFEHNHLESSSYLYNRNHRLIYTTKKLTFYDYNPVSNPIQYSSQYPHYCLIWMEFSGSFIWI